MNNSSNGSQLISIIIVTYNGLHYTKHCIESFYRFHISNAFEVIVVDNNSTDGSQNELPKLFPQIIFIPLTKNKGFGTANNAGAKKAKGNILFFVNNDTIFIKEIVSELGTVLSQNRDYGIIGPKLLNEDRRFQHSFGNFPSIGNEFSAMEMAKDHSLQQSKEIFSEVPVEKDWVTGAAIMIRRDLFERVGGFDEFFFMYFEDIDLCRMVNMQRSKVLYFPSVSLIHLGGKSYGKENNTITYEYRRSQLRYYDKHNSFLQRILIRVYIFMKFIPRLFSQKDKKLALNILKLTFAKA